MDDRQMSSDLDSLEAALKRANVPGGPEIALRQALGRSFVRWKLEQVPESEVIDARAALEKAVEEERLRRQDIACALEVITGMREAVNAPIRLEDADGIRKALQAHRSVYEAALIEFKRMKLKPAALQAEQRRVYELAKLATRVSHYREWCADNNVECD